jgi:hypothetical protein
MSSQKIISKRHTKNGEVILTIDFDLIKHWFVFNFFKYLINPIYSFLKFISSSLDRSTGRKSHLVISAGLGLGLGLSLIIAFYPAQIRAGQELIYYRGGLEITRIKSTDIGIDTNVKNGPTSALPLVSLEAPAVHSNTSAGIGSGKPIIIQGLNKDYSLLNLSQARLGDEIFVIGSNEGWYRYTVTEIKNISLDQLNSLFSQNQEVMILYTINSWQKSVAAVIARPRT